MKGVKDFDSDISENGEEEWGKVQTHQTVNKRQRLTKGTNTRVGTKRKEKVNNCSDSLEIKKKW